MGCKQVARIAFIERRPLIFARILSRYVVALRKFKLTNAHVEPYRKSPSSTERGRSQSGRYTTPKLLSLLVGCGKITLPGKRYPLMTSFDVKVILNHKLWVPFVPIFNEHIKPSTRRAIRGCDQGRESIVLKRVAHLYCDNGRRDNASSHVHSSRMVGTLNF